MGGLKRKPGRGAMGIRDSGHKHVMEADYRHMTSERKKCRRDEEL